MPFIRFLRSVLPDNPSKHREYFPWTFPNQLLKKSNLTALALCTNTVRASAGAQRRLNLGSSDEQKKRVRQGPGQGVGPRPPQERSPGTGAALWA